MRSAPFQQNELLGIPHRERAQQHLVQQREDSGICAYTEGHGDQGHGGEHGGCNERAERKAQIGKNVTHILGETVERSGG